MGETKLSEDQTEGETTLSEAVKSTNAEDLPPQRVYLMGWLETAQTNKVLAATVPYFLLIKPIANGGREWS